MDWLAAQVGCHAHQFGAHKHSKLAAMVAWTARPWQSPVDAKPLQLSQSSQQILRSKS